MIKFIRNFRDAYRDWCYWDDSSVCWSHPSGTWWFYRTVARLTRWIRFARDYRRALVCELRGHKWTSDGGWCTPDSGGDHFTCARCGQTHDVTYY